MITYTPIYTNKCGAKVHSSIWWYSFTVHGHRVQESSKTRNRRLAVRIGEKRRNGVVEALTGRGPSGTCINCGAEKILIAGVCSQRCVLAYTDRMRRAWITYEKESEWLKTARVMLRAVHKQILEQGAGAGN